MQPAKLRAWAIAKLQKDGKEHLAFWDPMLMQDRMAEEVALREMQRLNPELEGKLRVVPVVVDIREMTEEEAAKFKEANTQKD